MPDAHCSIMQTLRVLPEDLPVAHQERVREALASLEHSEQAETQVSHRS